MNLNKKLLRITLYFLAVWSIYGTKRYVSSAVVSNTKSVSKCKNERNQTEYCDSTCTKCVDGVGCVPSSKITAIFVPGVLKKTIFLRGMVQEWKSAKCRVSLTLINSAGPRQRLVWSATMESTAMELTSVNMIKTQKFQDVPDILVIHVNIMRSAIIPVMKRRRTAFARSYPAI